MKNLKVYYNAMDALDGVLKIVANSELFEDGSHLFSEILDWHTCQLEDWEVMPELIIPTNGEEELRLSGYTALGIGVITAEVYSMERNCALSTQYLAYNFSAIRDGDVWYEALTASSDIEAFRAMMIHIRALSPYMSVQAQAAKWFSILLSTGSSDGFEVVEKTIALSNDLSIDLAGFRKGNVLVINIYVGGDMPTTIIRVNK